MKMKDENCVSFGMAYGGIGVSSSDLIWIKVVSSGRQCRSFDERSSLMLAVLMKAKRRAVSKRSLFGDRPAQ